MAITYTSQQVRQLCQRSTKSLMRVTKAVYYDLKQLGISHATPTLTGTTGGLCQRATKSIPVVVTMARISRPTELTHSNNTLHTGAPSSNNTLHTGAPSSNLNNLTHIICNTDLRHFTSSSLTRFQIYVVPSICAPSRTLSIDSRLM